MQIIELKASTSYKVYVGSGNLNNCGEIISSVRQFKRAVIVTDDIVSGLYSETVKNSLKNSGISVDVFVFKNGEESKSHTVLTEIYNFLTEKGVTRTDLIVALGGGVVGDITGYAAATYLRGIDVVHIPTTLLSQTDSSIGGKTAVNIAAGKNLVGAFKQPLCVISDTDTISTLSEEIYADGMSEIIKYGMIKSKELFDILSAGFDLEKTEDIIARCINIKKQVVEQDEFDKGERMLLNFGHTLGHSIEKHYNFTGISHGRAVSIGMMIMSEFCEKSGLSAAGTTNLLKECLEKYNLPTKIDVPISKLIKACLNDKKMESDKINIIICSEIGKSRILKLSIPEFYKLMELDYV